MLVYSPVYPEFEKDRNILIGHLSELSSEDRYFRFGTAVSNEQLVRYVNGIKHTDLIICAFDHNVTDKPVGFMHVAYGGSLPDLTAEIGFSVLPQFREKGIGTNLFKRALTKCQNLKVAHIYTYCVPSNIPVQKMLMKLGFEITRDFDQNTGELKLSDPTIFSFYRGVLYFEQELAGTMLANIVRLSQK